MDEFKFGIEVLPEERRILKKLSGKRVALLGHPASVDKNLTSSVDILRDLGAKHNFALTSLFGPQHGFGGEKQDNMIESDDYKDEETGIEVFSLYGETRRISQKMIDSFDVLFVDLQDVGVRVYTFLTTLCYLLEDLSPYKDKMVIVLDRPNPTGRIMDGLVLRLGWESFVGITSVPMQHGLTLGEFALWYKDKMSLSANLEVIPMEGYTLGNLSPGWPDSRIWVQPSPNMPALYTARAYTGTVILEGTTLSEARGTTRPLSMFGHPDVNWRDVWRWLKKEAPESFGGCFLRDVVFEPTFHKHAGVPTGGFEIITEGGFYDPALFRPYLLIASVLKAIKRIHPDLVLWATKPYEYEYEKLPIDVITGGTIFRDWVESDSTVIADLIRLISADLGPWKQEAEPYYLY
jgi:uncharacterized protein YbbC (DUF1343 family)